PGGPGAELQPADGEHVPGRVRDFAVKDVLQVEVDVACVEGEEYHAEGEQGGERDADRRVGPDPAVLQGLDGRSGGQTGGGRSDEHRNDPPVVGDEEGEDDPQEDRV